MHPNALKYSVSLCAGSSFLANTATTTTAALKQQAAAVAAQLQAANCAPAKFTPSTVVPTQCVVRARLASPHMFEWRTALAKHSSFHMPAQLAALYQWPARYRLSACQVVKSNIWIIICMCGCSHALLSVVVRVG